MHMSADASRLRFAPRELLTNYEQLRNEPIRQASYRPNVGRTRRQMLPREATFESLIQ